MSWLRLDVRPTRDGIALAVFTVALFAVARLSGNNLLILLVATQTALLVVGTFAGRRNLDRLEIRRDLPPEIFAGRPAPGAFVLRRTDGRATFDLTVEELGAVRSRAAVDVIPGGESARLRASWTARRRGVHGLHRVRVRSRYPFGLAERWVVLEVPDKLCVWPAPTDGSPGGADPGELAGSRSLEPDELDQIRHYRPGDRLRDIHWASSARAGRTMVVERRGHADVPVWVQVDPASGEAWERELSRAAGAILQGFSAGRAVGLRLGTDAWPPRHGAAWRRQLLSVLATAPEPTP